MSYPHLYFRARDGELRCWRATTLQREGLSEAFLEDLIAEDLSALALPAHGIRYTQARSFRQVTLSAADGRKICPDLIALTDTGHVIIVEVKRLGNPELRGRAVIAQTLDYVAGITTIDERALCLKLSDGQSETLEALTALCFPSATHPDWLARDYRRALATGEVLALIVCDQAPPGTRDQVEALAQQQSLAFELRVIELTPYVCEDQPGDVIVQAQHPIATEIIARTTVVIRDETGGDRVIVQVGVDEPEEVRERFEEATRPQRRRDHKSAALEFTAQSQALTTDQLFAELDAIHQHALTLDWDTLSGPSGALLRVYEQLAWHDTPRGPYLRGRNGSGIADGRLGVDLVSGWKPSLFIGVLLDPRDHSSAHSDPEKGADLVVILSVHRKWRSPELKGDEYLAHPLFAKLRERLTSMESRWSVDDQLSRARCNRWHPLHLRIPLADVFAECSSAEERASAWLDATRDGVERFLAGGELANLREEFGDR